MRTAAFSSTTSSFNCRADQEVSVPSSHTRTHASLSQRAHAEDSAGCLLELDSNRAPQQRPTKTLAGSASMAPAVERDASVVQSASRLYKDRVC